jgi:hypothetical protein
MIMSDDNHDATFHTGTADLPSGPVSLPPNPRTGDPGWTSEIPASDIDPPVSDMGSGIYARHPAKPPRHDYYTHPSGPALGERPPSYDQAFTTPDFYDSEADARRRVRRGLILVVGLMVVAVIIGMAVAVQRVNALPASVPLIGKDTGLAACEAAASGKDIRGEEKQGTPDAVMTEQQYRQARAIFADSRYAEIRDPGVQMIDLMWQVQAVMKTEDGMAALTLVQPLTRAYTELAGGCAKHGHIIPALGS